MALSKRLRRNRGWLALLALTVIVAATWYLTMRTPDTDTAEATYTTEAVSTGTLSVTVSGSGNLELADCESRTERRQRVDARLADRYRAAYARHFTLWREACRRYGVLFARVPCDGELRDALAHEARLSGAVEATR